MKIAHYTRLLTALAFAVLICACSANAQLASPCHNDTTDYSLRLFRNDNAIIPCYNQWCIHVDSCEVIQLPQGMIGTTWIGTDPVDTFHVLLLNSCDTVRVDTCIVLGQAVGHVLQMQGTFITNYQVAICGPAADIYIRCEFDPAYAMPFPALMLLDTLCPQVSITPQEIDSRSFQYHDLRGIPHLPPLQSGMYIRNTVGTNERVKIVVSDH